MTANDTPEQQRTGQPARPIGGPPSESLRKLAAERVQPSPANVSGMSIEAVERLVYELQIHQEELDMQNEELRRVQLEVQASRDRYADLYDFAPVGYLTLSDSDRITEANLTLATMLEVDRSKLVGTRLSRYCDISSRRILHTHLKEVLSSKTHQCCKLVCRTPGGKEIHARLDSKSCAELPDMIPIRAVLTDIGDQHEVELSLRENEEKFRRMDAQFAHVSRLSTMGEMMAGIAHEINQPLYAIANYAQATSNMIKDADRPYDPLIDTWLKRIKQQAVSCGEIVRGLQKFVKKRDDDRRRCDLNCIVRDSINLMESDKRHKSVIVECDVTDPGPQVYANEVQLQQVLVNLLLNACEATSEVATPRIKLGWDLLSGRVRLSVEDNGPGVDATQRPQLFHAFYTTKPDGMGMGLAISRSIIEAHSGSLGFEQGTSRGAKFLIDLPLAATGNDQAS